MVAVSRFATAIGLLAAIDVGCGGSTGDSDTPLQLRYPGARYDAGYDSQDEWAIADMNGDGIKDVIVGYSNGVSVLLGSRDGTLHGPILTPVGNNVTAIAAADFDGDGFADVAAGAYPGVQVFLGMGDGTILMPAHDTIIVNNFFVIAGDFDVDGIVDLLAGPDPTALLYRGRGDGTFDSTSVAFTANDGASIVIGDFNGDGAPDVASILSGTGQIAVHMNDGFGGAGSYAELDLGSNELVAADANGDGIDDLIGFSFPDLFALLGSASGIETTPVITAHPDIPLDTLAPFDYNHDGFVDIVAAAYSTGHMVRLTGQGDGSFGSEQTLFGVGAMRRLNLVDVGGDGVEDAVGLYDTGISVWTGRSDGTFRGGSRIEPQNFNGDSLLLVDLDEDGYLDAVTPSYWGVMFYLGDPHSVLAEGTEVRVVVGDVLGLAALDVNRDGTLDVVGTNGFASAIEVFLGDGAGGFTLDSPIAAEPGAAHLALLDTNTDGLQDLLVANGQNDMVSVYRSIESGGFETPVHFSVGDGPNWLAIGRFNDDEIADVATCNVGGSVSILLGNASGGFDVSTPVSFFGFGLAIGAGDFNADGLDDLAVGGDGGFWIFLNNGDGTFELVREDDDARPRAIVVADLTNDGNVDVTFGPFLEDDIAVITGAGDGSFADPVRFTLVGFPQSLAVGRFSDDNHPDIVSMSYPQGLELLLSRP